MAKDGLNKLIFLPGMYFYWFDQFLKGFLNIFENWFIFGKKWPFSAYFYVQIHDIKPQSFFLPKYLIRDIQSFVITHIYMSINEIKT